MKMHILSVYDKATGAYLQPIFTNSKGSVLRQLTDLVKEKQHPFGQHPEDYTLFDLGFWDDSAGLMLTSEPTKLYPLLDLDESHQSAADLENAEPAMLKEQVE